MKLFARVAYSGEDFLGFQRQPSGRTVQKELEKALTLLNGAEVQIRGASRTDAGVHALGQAFSFPFQRETNLDELLTALNRLLPEDIYVTKLVEVPEDFDARLDSTGKIYQYQFRVHRRNPLQVKKVAQIERDDFDFDAFLRGISAFEGEHNFQNFTTKEEDRYGFIRRVTILSCSQEEDGNLISLRLKGEGGFMRYQIRLMVGAALRVACGKMSVEEIRQALDSPMREVIAYKAPAAGLTLMEVLYENHPGL